MRTVRNPKSAFGVPAKPGKLDAKRMKDIIAQLADIIYMQCNAKSLDATTIFDQFTNITPEELKALNIVFSNDEED